MKIRKACGPWVYVKVNPPPEKTATGLLYMPSGNLEERKGQLTGTVLSTGPGKWDDKKGRYTPTGVAEGETIFFRGFLSEANRPHQFDREHCFLHMDDILGVIE